MKSSLCTTPGFSCCSNVAFDELQMLIPLLDQVDLCPTVTEFWSLLAAHVCVWQSLLTPEHACQFIDQ